MLMLQYFINAIINFYVIVILVSVILSWLIAFNVINRHNQFVDMVWRFTTALTEPLLRPIRNILPNLGGIDLSPLILYFGIRAIQIGLNHYIFRPAISAGL